MNTSRVAALGSNSYLATLESLLNTSLLRTYSWHPEDSSSRWEELSPSTHTEQLRTSRLLAGRALTWARKEYLDHSPFSTLKDDELKQIQGVGLLAVQQDNVEQFFISQWTPSRVLTFHHQREAVSDIKNYQLPDSIIHLLQICTTNDSTSWVEETDLPIVCSSDTKSSIEKLLDHPDQVSYCLITEDGQVQYQLESASPNAPRAVLPGSFNPLHEGHVAMLTQSASWDSSSSDLLFELSVHNADKPSLPLDIVLDRVSQFAGRYNILLDAFPLFMDKAKLFAPVKFVVGFDTARRIIDPKYYHDSVKEMESQVGQLREWHSGFLVCGRTMDGIWENRLPRVSQVWSARSRE